MGKLFYDICYECLSQHLRFQDVAETYKSISDGRYYQAVYPYRLNDYNLRCEIISYIEKVRYNNIIDAYQKKENPLLLIPQPSGKLLSQASPNELYDNLSAEIPRLILKGMHQLIKHLNVIYDDNKLTAELLQNDVAVLHKYGL